jgi:hypothetical protein
MKRNQDLHIVIFPIDLCPFYICIFIFILHFYWVLKTFFLMRLLLIF